MALLFLLRRTALSRTIDQLETARFLNLENNRYCTPNKKSSLNRVKKTFQRVENLLNTYLFKVTSKHSIYFRLVSELRIFIYGLCAHYFCSSLYLCERYEIK